MPEAAACGSGIHAPNSPSLSCPLLSQCPSSWYASCSLPQVEGAHAGSRHTEEERLHTCSLLNNLAPRASVSPSGKWINRVKHILSDTQQTRPHLPASLPTVTSSSSASILWEALRSGEADFQVISPPALGCGMDFDQEQGDIWQKLLMRD